MATLVSRDTSGVYIAQPNEAERGDRRTRSFKVFQKSATEFRVAGQVGPIHFKSDPFDEQGAYQEIDLSVNLTPGQPWDAAMESNGYQVRLWQNRVIGGRNVRYIAQFRRAGHWLGMAPAALIWTNTSLSLPFGLMNP